MTGKGNGMKKNGLINIPNVLTMIRLMLVPVFAACYFLLPHKRWTALVIFLTASATDVADGYLARRLNQITWFGKLFDPTADKLMCVTMLYCLAATGYIPWWILAVMVLKESYMAAGSAYMLSRNYVVKADIFGKLATLLFVVSIVMVFPWHVSEAVTTIGRVLMIAAVICSVTAAVHYTWMAVHHREEEYRA